MVAQDFDRGALAAPFEAGGHGLRMDHEQAEQRALDRHARAAEGGVESVEEGAGIGQPPALAQDPGGNAILLFFRGSDHGVPDSFAAPSLTSAQSNATYAATARGASHGAASLLRFGFAG